LARVQTDYGFYIGCQTNPGVALAGYSLSPDERLALTDPERLADVIKRGIGIDKLRPVTVKISGSHDWINPAAPPSESADRKAEVTAEVAAIRAAASDGERRDAVVRLMGLIG